MGWVFRACQNKSTHAHDLDRWDTDIAICIVGQYRPRQSAVNLSWLLSSPQPQSSWQTALRECQGWPKICVWVFVGGPKSYQVPWWERLTLSLAGYRLQTRAVAHLQSHEEARPAIHSSYCSQMSRRLGPGWHCCSWQNSDTYAKRLKLNWQCTNWDFLCVPGRWQSYTCNVLSFIVPGATGWSRGQG